MSKSLLSDQLSVDTMAENILDVWYTAQPWMLEFGATWYVDAHKWAADVARDTGSDITTVAAIIAAFSPQTRWADNLAFASAYLSGNTRPKGSMRSAQKRAFNVIAAANPLDGLGKGPKVNAFARNILGDTDAVTVDVWAARVAFGITSKRDKEDSARAGKMLSWVGSYAKVSDAYRKAAAEAGVPASVMQATVWVAIRGKAD